MIANPFRRVLAVGLVTTTRLFAQPAPVEPEDEIEVPSKPAEAEAAPDAASPPASAPSTPAPSTPAPAASAPPAPAPSTPAPPATSTTAPATPAPAEPAKPAATTAPAAAATTEPQPAPATAEKGDDEPRRFADDHARSVPTGFRWEGFIQAQYQRSQLSEDQLAPGGTPLNRDQFVLRRARLRFDHGWQYAAATLELDGSTVRGLRVGLRRAEATLLYRGSDDDQAPPLVALTGGITDLPFGAELAESQRRRLFMERSTGSLALFPTEADVGFKLWGAYRFLTYAVALVNGQPLNDDTFPSDPNAAKDLSGRIGARADLSDIARLEGGVSFYTGEGFSPGRDATKDSVVWIDDNHNGTAEPHEILGVTGSAAVRSRNFERWALGLDAGASLLTPLGLSRLTGEVIVANNLDRGLVPSDPVLSGSDVRQTVLSVALVQELTRWGAVAFRASFYDPNSDLLEQRAGEFHAKNQTIWTLSPALALTLAQARVVAQYDFILDYLGRDELGVPSDASNDQLTLRLQVDL